MMGLISNIDIKSYRGIEFLHLDKLQQINILTGDNNSGKTSILEIINTFSQPDNFRSWLSVSREARTVDGMSVYERMNDFFNVNLTEKKIEYTITENNICTKVEVLAKDSEEQISESKYYETVGYYSSSDDEESDEEKMIIIPKTSLTIKINGKTQKTMDLFEGQRRFPLNLKKDKNDYSHNIIYISPFEHTNGRLFLNDILNDPELYQEILDVLKEFDPGIISINFDDGGYPRRGGFYRILSKENNRALPLDMYGDGMKKAVLLMSAVVKAKNGVLLLDEFETAIHTSAMERVFKWILETCCKLNVQVFLTSHSEEAINKVLNCSEELLDNIAIYTLYKDEEGNTVRRLDGKKARDVSENMGLELR